MSKHRETQIHLNETKASFLVTRSEGSSGLEALHKTLVWNFIFFIFYCKKNILGCTNGRKSLFLITLAHFP